MQGTNVKPSEVSYHGQLERHMILKKKGHRLHWPCRDSRRKVQISVSTMSAIYK